MIARIHILLPYALTIPEKEPYHVYGYKYGGYIIRFFFPRKSEKADSYSGADITKINGKVAMNADALHIEFQKKRFDRTNNKQTDPPLELIEEVTNDFMSRLRYATNASKVKLIKLSESNWTCTYLKDDGTELKKDKRYLRERGMRRFEFSYVALNNEIWENINSIPPGYNLPAWKTLLLDAESILPEIGPAIVLTFTALEVFISKILDDIVKHSGIESDFWEWINNRGYLKEPSIEEKYDFLSSHLIGKSIKDDNQLWEAFKHIRRARNSFAHTGVAMIGEEIITIERTQIFIKKAKEIIEFIKNQIPEELRWPEFNHQVQIEFIQKIMESKKKNS